MGRLLMASLLVAALARLGWLWWAEERTQEWSARPSAEDATRPATAVESAAPGLDSQALPAARGEPERERQSRKPGPSGADEAHDDPHYDLLVRVVDPSGQPRPGISLRLERGSNDPGGPSVPGPVVTDGSGRGRLAGIRSALENAERPWKLRHELPFAEPPRSTLDRATLARPGRVGAALGRSARGRRARPRGLGRAGGLHGPAQARGRVNVVAGANLDSPMGLFGDRSGAIHGVTDEQGRFELRGLLVEDGFELRAEQDSQRSDRVRAQQGERDIELVLMSRYTLSGRLLLDPGIDPRSIQFQLQAPGADPVSASRRHEERWLSHRLRDYEDESDGQFELDPVPAGDYALICLLERFELARVEGLSVRADTDVGNIDLAVR